MKRPKVCFIVTDAISYQMLCRGQFEYLKENSNFDITFISGGGSKDFEKLVERNVGNVFDAKFVRKPSALKDLKSLISLITYLTLNRFDLVIYSTPKALLLGSIATSITLHRNTVAIVRGRAYENYKGHKRKAYKLLDKISLLASHKVLFISNSLMNAYIEEGLVSTNKSSILGLGSSNGVDTTMFIPSDISNTCSQYDVVTNYNNKFLVLIAGRVCPDKGLYDLAEIIKTIRNDNIQFCLVGPVEGVESEEFLEDIMFKYSCVSHVPYTDNIQDYFRTADLHLFLTHREGFGNVAIEAASCGIPTFAYDVIGVKDSVKEGVSGKKFDFQDLKAIASAIDDASEDTDFSKRYPNSRAWVVENFEKQKVWKNYLNFYNLVLNKNS